jgi:hypothetical protein
MKLINKTNLCIMSMELIFILAFIKSIDIPVYFGSDWEFIGWSNLFLHHPGNFVALLCLLGLIWSQCISWSLRHKLKGSPDTLPIRIRNIKNKDTEYMSLLFTILTIVSFDFSNIRDIIVFAVVFCFYCVILKRTDWYAASPILALNGIHLYAGETDKLPQDTIFLSYGEIPIDGEITRPFQKISKTVYWLYPKVQ